VARNPRRACGSLELVEPEARQRISERGQGPRRSSASATPTKRIRLGPPRVGGARPGRREEVKPREPRACSPIAGRPTRACMLWFRPRSRGHPPTRSTGRSRTTPRASLLSTALLRRVLLRGETPGPYARRALLLRSVQAGPEGSTIAPPAHQALIAAPAQVRRFSSRTPRGFPDSTRNERDARAAFVQVPAFARTPAARIGSDENEAVGRLRSPNHGLGQTRTSRAAEDQRARFVPVGHRMPLLHHRRCGAPSHEHQPAALSPGCGGVMDHSSEPRSSIHVVALTTP
jgi:hypothetical protein